MKFALLSIDEVISSFLQNLVEEHGLQFEHLEPRDLSVQSNFDVLVLDGALLDRVTLRRCLEILEDLVPRPVMAAIYSQLLEDTDRKMLAAQGFILFEGLRDDFLEKLLRRAAA